MIINSYYHLCPTAAICNNKPNSMFLKTAKNDLDKREMHGKFQSKLGSPISHTGSLKCTFDKRSTRGKSFPRSLFHLKFYKCLWENLGFD